MPFQSTVTQNFAPAQEGDFASANTWHSSLAGPGALVAGTGGLRMGRFAWIDASRTYATNAGTGAPAGFIHRIFGEALITSFLGEVSNIIPQGYEVTVHQQGDFWARTTTPATFGQKVFASNTDGSVATGAPGATVAGFTETKWTVGSAGAAGELIKITTWAEG